MRAFVRGLLILGMLTAAADAAAQCAKDIDCKGNRVCTKGECVEVAPVPVPVASPTVAPTPPVPPVVVIVPPPPVIIVPSPEHRVRNVIAVNIGDILTGSSGIQYERVLSRWFGLAFEVSFFDSDTNIINPSDVTVLGVAFIIKPRFYLLPWPRWGAPRGLYLSPMVSVGYMSAKETADTYAFSGVGYAIGGMVGWSWVTRGGFAVRVGVGGQYIHMAAAVEDEWGDTKNVGVGGPALLGELALGWAF